MQQHSLFLDTPAFHKTKSYQALETYAKAPFDLAKDGALTDERVRTMRAQGAGFSYLYGFERVDHKTLQALFELAFERKAIEQMEAMQAGEVVNFIQGYPSENRPALHTALRDVFDHPQKAPKAKEAAELSKQELQKLKTFIESHKQYSDLIVVGIGGSELGPRALYLGLSFYHKKDRRVHFIGNIDPDDVAQTLKQVDLKKSLVVIISKSGTTLETATNEAFLRKAFEQKGLQTKDHFIAITMPKTPMDDPSRYLACFHIWDYIGGRYSATSMVGLLLLSFGIGFNDCMELLRGAHDMDRVALKKDPKENLPLLAALFGIWNHNFLHYPTTAVIPYAQVLSRFPAHLQQCDMESNGKRILRTGEVAPFQTGPIIWGEPGTNAQHSFYQLIHQGTQIVPVELIGFATSQSGTDFEWNGTTSQEKLLSNLFAQAVALAVGKKDANPNKTFPGNRPTSLLFAKKLTPYALGALLAFYEHKVAFQGFIWGVNSFDQEGVQLGKVLADRFIEQFANKRTHKQHDFPIGQALIQIAEEYVGEL
jgi:glucose-6-phosphate isomerase